jgi:hypothetical protein
VAYFASLLPLNIELDLGPVDERYLRANHVDMYDDDSIFFNFDSTPKLINAITKRVLKRRFPAFDGLLMHAVDSEQDPADILDLNAEQRQKLAHFATYSGLAEFLVMACTLGLSDRDCA